MANINDELLRKILHNTTSRIPIWDIDEEQDTDFISTLASDNGLLSNQDISSIFGDYWNKDNSEEIIKNQVVRDALTRSGNSLANQLRTLDTQGSASTTSNDNEIFSMIKDYNKGLGQRTDLLHGAKTATNLGLLLNNIMQPEGDKLPSQINLTRPDIQYDDTLRRRMVSEAGKQSNVAQMNAMKMGMGSAIPAISASMLSATNDANTQAQASINEVQQKNAIMAADIANKEVEANLMLKEKNIQDALMKNELRNKAISGQTDTTFRDLGKWQQQREAINQEDMLADIFKRTPQSGGNVNEWLKATGLSFSDGKGTSRKGKGTKFYDRYGNEIFTQ